ncbi:MAG: RNA polymerase sigma factor [Gemmataceae bacterium]
MRPVDDANEVELARAGDRQAFAILVERYWGRVLRWLTSLAPHHQQAEDLTQETFLRAWKGLADFRPGASFRAWLFGIARHCFIDWKRARARAGREPLRADPPCSAPGPAEAAVQREGEALLQAACDRLPEHFRAAFLLWAQEEMTHAEIADALHISEETARWRVFKARHLLVQDLGAYLDRNKP